MPLIRLLPEQVMEYWHDIREAMRAALPPTTEWNNETVLALQEQMLTGEMECWFYKHDAETIGIVTTRVAHDPCSYTPYLFIYTITAFGAMPVPFDAWRDSYATLRRYAESRHCAKIVGYTQIPHIVEYAKHLGAVTTWHMIELEV